MCLLVFSHQVSPHTPLVIAANRDEFHARPTAPSTFWPEHRMLLAGKDLEQGGTWMGVTRSGRFAAVTNYRDPSRTAPAPRSRGELPLQYLAGTEDAQSFLGRVAAQAGEYAGFNLLLGDRDTLWYFSNSCGEPQCLPPGIYGLSNARLDTPWPKVELGKTKLQHLMDAGPLSHDGLATTVADRSYAAPDTLRSQGQDGAMEQILSAQFIVTDTYGTRSNTTLWIDGANVAHWREQSFDHSGTLSDTQQHVFTLE